MTASRSSVPPTAHDVHVARRAVQFIVLIGLVSFFADLTYEGARSVTGPFLDLLGAPAVVVGLVAGLGELVGYALRLVSGRLADQTRAYWPIALAGYLVQMAAVPLLALAGSWELAALLIVLERVGKAIRNPSRDVMLSYAARGMGYGWGFGLHEAMDQAGALVGPLVVTGVLLAGGDERRAFALLAIPAAITYGLLVFSRLIFPRPQALEPATPPVSTTGYTRAFWLYLIGAMLVAAGFADFALISYHFAAARTVNGVWVPALYAIAMGVGGAGSLLFGRAFDRWGVGILLPLTLLSALFAPLVFLGGITAAAFGMALWGIGTGVHESIMAAVVAVMVPAERRGSAYGLFNLAYGVAWFLGSVLLGALYGWSVIATVIAALVLELAALPCFWTVARNLRNHHQA